MVFWIRWKQISVTLNTVEAKYIAASLASCEAVLLQKLVKVLFDQAQKPTLIHCDNQSCVKLSKNHVFHDKSKKIEIKYHYIRGMVQRGSIELQYISTNEKIA